MRDDASEELGALSDESKRDRRAERVPAYPRWRQSQVLDERREIGDVLADAALSGRTSAVAVTASV